MTRYPQTGEIFTNESARRGDVVDVLDSFHPAVANWFRRTYPAPTEPQIQAWPAISSGKNALIAAPTGSGKTLAAFLATIDALIRLGVRGDLRDEIHVVYVSPLKALSNDIQKNLDEPLAGIRKELFESGLADVDIRTVVRTAIRRSRSANACGASRPISW